MSQPLPKPDLRRVLAAIREQTQLGADKLAPVVGDSTYDVEQVVRGIVTECINVGINLQRDAVTESSDDLDTPLIPPPSEVPAAPTPAAEEDQPTRRTRKLPKPPKLPSGVKG